MSSQDVPRALRGTSLKAHPPRRRPTPTPPRRQRKPPLINIINGRSPGFRGKPHKCRRAGMKEWRQWRGAKVAEVTPRPLPSGGGGGGAKRGLTQGLCSHNGKINSLTTWQDALMSCQVRVIARSHRRPTGSSQRRHSSSFPLGSTPRSSFTPPPPTSVQ